METRPNAGLADRRRLAPACRRNADGVGCTATRSVAAKDGFVSGFIRGKGPRVVLLTPNQHAIVQLLLAGEAAPAIARATKRSVDTVRQTIRAIYSRFGVRSSAELATGLSECLFRVHITDNDGRERNYRSAVASIHRALTMLRSENLRTGAKRRRIPVRLHESELEALLIVLAQRTESNEPLEGSASACVSDADRQSSD